MVKPFANLVHGRRGLVQPGLKVRGREYLRIIYGPEYTAAPRPVEGPVARAQARAGAAGVRARAGVAGPAGRGEPLWRVHEPVFAVLALESEPVDPRL